MASDDTQMSASAALREQGNTLYKAGKIEQAIEPYQEAAKLSPTDPAPLSNLSAAYYEIGDYPASVAASDQALALLQDKTKKQKVRARKAKCLVHCLDYQAVAEALEHLPDDDDRENIAQVVRNALEARESVKDALEIRSRLINELPRCKPQIRNIPEYFVVGHDIPESLYDESLLQTGRDKISLFFAGIGDSRHLHATFVSLVFDDMKGTLPQDRSFHFTICDHKPAVIARDILMYGVLSDLAEMGDDMMKKVESFNLPLLFYLFLSPIMPEPLHMLLQHNIAQLIEALEEPSSFQMKVINISPMFRPQVLRVLQEWRQEAGAEYHTARMRKETIRLRAKDRIDRERYTAQYVGREAAAHKAPEDCSKEDAFYRKTGILMMHWLGLERAHEEEIRKAYEEFDPENPGRLNTTFLDKVDAEWRTNPTFVDLDWQRNREASHADIFVGHDPFEFGRELERSGMAALEREGVTNGLLNHVAMWFDFVSKGVKCVKPRLKIECCIGDITTVLEQIRVGAVGHRAPLVDDAILRASEHTDDGTQAGAIEEASTPSPVPGSRLSPKDQPDNFPKSYDRIHLSNIPDYVGGSFATFLYALPVLNAGEQCYVTANCLRNPPRFKTHVHFNHEYLAGLSNPAELAKIFQVRMEELENPEEILVLSDYVKWYRHDVPRNFENLLPRAHIETWLFRFFLKICIPLDRKMRDFTLINSPLNLTAFVRLCAHLHEVGYPAHWISVVLSEICSGKITTRARPPRSDPLSFEETRADFPMLEQSTAPFVAEITTLLSLWQPNLSFGVLSPHIPPIETIHQYGATFREVPDLIAEAPSFILVLFSMRMLPVEAEENGIRQFLLSDERANTSKKGRIAREEGIHVISTWDWDRKQKKATFWLRKDVFESLDARTWGVSIWRTDAWIRQAGPIFLKDGVVDEGTWLEEGGWEDEESWTDEE